MRHYLHTLNYPGKDETVTYAQHPKIMDSVHHKLDYSNKKKAEKVRKQHQLTKRHLKKYDTAKEKAAKKKAVQKKVRAQQVATT
jgi:hypothetical protein